MTEAKEKNCFASAKEDLTLATKVKKQCLSNFSNCKKAEDASIGILFECKSGIRNRVRNRVQKNNSKGICVLIARFMKGYQIKEILPP